MGDMENTNIIMQRKDIAMIDWHTHILPGIDDGCKNVTESIAILEHYRNRGVSAVVLTPHFYPHKESVDRFLKRRDKAVKKLENGITEASLGGNSLPQLIIGAEVFFYPELARMEESRLKRLCIGDSSYLMIELPLETWNNRIYESLENLICNRGIKPVLAHINRYYHCIKNPAYLKDLVDMGMLIQLNTEALDGFLSRRRALKWIKSGYVQLLGSDCHNMTTRKPNLHYGVEIIERCIGEKVNNRLTIPALYDIFEQ